MMVIVVRETLALSIWMLLNLPDFSMQYCVWMLFFYCRLVTQLVYLFWNKLMGCECVGFVHASHLHYHCLATHRFQVAV